MKKKFDYCCTWLIFDPGDRITYYKFYYEVTQVYVVFLAGVGILYWLTLQQWQLLFIGITCSTL